MEKSKSDIKTQSNYYEIFEIPYSASPKQIILAYENKITKFNNVVVLNQEQINEIKLLKVGLFVLVNLELRNLYNKVIGIKREPNKAIEQTEPVAGNQDTSNSLDSLFNVDNTWMKSNNTKPDNSGRKEKNGSNALGDRIFSLSEFNKRPGFSSDFEIELRKPQQGRTDKSDEKIHNK